MPRTTTGQARSCSTRRARRIASRSWRLSARGSTDAPPTGSRRSSPTISTAGPARTAGSHPPDNLLTARMNSDRAHRKWPRRRPEERRRARRPLPAARRASTSRSWNRAWQFDEATGYMTVYGDRVFAIEYPACRRAITLQRGLRDAWRPSHLRSCCATATSPCRAIRPTASTAAEAGLHGVGGFARRSRPVEPHRSAARTDMPPRRQSASCHSWRLDTPRFIANFCLRNGCAARRPARGHSRNSRSGPRPGARRRP